MTSQTPQHESRGDRGSSPGPLLVGFRWPARVEHPIAAPATRLWEVVAAPGNLEPCHPFCARNTAHIWPGAGSRDELEYLSGRVLERRFLHWYDGIGYDLEIGRRGGRTSKVSWRIASLGEDRCSLAITVYPHVLQELPPILRWFPYRFRIRPMLERYLRSVARGFDWYTTRGEPVPRNQFGEHPWFS